MSNNPIEIFTELHKQTDSDAVALATVNDDMQPSVRIVLLKKVTSKGFVFFTNLKSRKANEIHTNPKGAMMFFWPEIHKQVRIEGNIDPILNKDADEYFKQRPRMNNIGAWASKQSQELQSEQDLKNRIRYFDNKFASCDVPRPEFWSGFVLIPHSMEFWTEGDNRLHTREVFESTATGWNKKYLFP